MAVAGKEMSCKRWKQEVGSCLRSSATALCKMGAPFLLLEGWMEFETHRRRRNSSSL